MERCDKGGERVVGVGKTVEDGVMRNGSWETFVVMKWFGKR